MKFHYNEFKFVTRTISYTDISLYFSKICLNVIFVSPSLSPKWLFAWDLSTKILCAYVQSLSPPSYLHAQPT
jgi:hypothetical protein